MIRAIEVHRSKFPDIRDDRLDAESAYSEDSLDTFYGTDRCVFSVFEVVDVCRRKAQFNTQFFKLPLVPKCTSYRANSGFADEFLIRAPRGEIAGETMKASAENLDTTSGLNLKYSPTREGATHRQDEDGTRSSLVAVTVSMRSGLQFQHHFDTSETLGTVATWGLRNNAIASDDSEEFFIAQPTVRFTPSNLKRTLSELRLPRSVVLSVVKKTQRSAAAFAAAALESANPDERSVRPDARVYVPPGAPV
jgi:hypothetical protein